VIKRHTLGEGDKTGLRNLKRFTVVRMEMWVCVSAEHSCRDLVHKGTSAYGRGNVITLRSLALLQEAGLVWLSAITGQCGRYAGIWTQAEGLSTLRD